MKKKSVKSIPRPECSLSRDRAMPTIAQMDGFCARLADFLGVSKPNHAETFKALSGLLADTMNECARECGVNVNGGKVTGKGMLVYRREQRG